MARVVGIRFRKACKVYDFNANGQDLYQGDTVIVEVDRGLGMGVVADEPVEKDEKGLSYKLKRVIRKADKVDMERQQFNVERENEAYRICKEKIKSANLEMKLIRVEYLFDSSKAIFYFTSDGRIDFRVLVKDLASLFHTRIEMRQIGVRDEAKVVGGIGPCGRELCCTNFLSNFAPVTVKMAKEQNLALNPAKISGLCGRLMCCLSYEYRSYQKGAGKGIEAPGKAGAGHGGGGGGCCGAVAGRKGPGAPGDRTGERKNKEERRPRDEKRPRDERRARADRRSKQGDGLRVEKEAGGENRPKEEIRVDAGGEPGGEERPRRERRSRRGRRRGGRGRRNRGARESSQTTDSTKRQGEQKEGGQKPEIKKQGGPDESGGGSS
jgi:cell fate regulator YaaT (PSP1 superfamily)